MLYRFSQRSWYIITLLRVTSVYSSVCTLEKEISCGKTNISVLSYTPTTLYGQHNDDEWDKTASRGSCHVGANWDTHSSNILSWIRLLNSHANTSSMAGNNVTYMQNQCYKTKTCDQQHRILCFTHYHITPLKRRLHIFITQRITQQLPVHVLGNASSLSTLVLLPNNIMHLHSQVSFIIPLNNDRSLHYYSDNNNMIDEEHCILKQWDDSVLSP